MLEKAVILVDSWNLKFMKKQRYTLTFKFDYIKEKWNIGFMLYPWYSNSMVAMAFASLETTSATLSPPSGPVNGSFTSRSHISGYCKHERKKKYVYKYKTSTRTQRLSSTNYHLWQRNYFKWIFSLYFFIHYFWVMLFSQT